MHILSSSATRKPWTERLAFGLLLLFVFTIPWENAVVLGIGSVSRAAGLAAFFFGLLSLVDEGELRLRPPSLFLGLAIVYIGWSSLSYFWSVDPPATRESIITYAQLLVMIWLIWQLCRKRADQHALFQAYVLGAYVAVFDMLSIFFLHQNEIRIDGRITSSGANQNDIAAILALGLCIAWYLVLVRRNRLLFWINLAYLPLALFAIVLTGSRGGLLVAAAVLSVVPWTLGGLNFWRRTAITLLAIGAPLTLFATMPTLIERLTPNVERLGSITTEVRAGDLSGREEIWQAGFAVLKEHPMLGVGSGGFRRAILPVMGIGYAPHSAFVSVLVETGFIGLLLFLLLLLVALLPLLSHGEWLPRVVLTALFAGLVLAIIPLGWEYYKTTWLILSLMTTEVAFVLNHRGDDEPSLGALRLGRAR